MAGFPPATNALLSAIRRNQLQNPFPHARPPTLTPTPGLPASFGLPPAPAPQQGALSGMPSSSPPAPDPMAALRQSYQGLQNFQPYQPTPISWQPPSYVENPKADAIQSGVELLGAALLPNYAHNIDQTMAQQKQLKDADYQRRYQEASDKYQAQVGEQGRLSQASLGQEGLLEKRFEAAGKLAEANAAFHEKQRVDTANIARANAYAQRQVFLNTNDARKLDETVRHWGQTLNLRNVISLRGIAEQQNKDQVALERTNLDNTTRAQVADLHARTSVLQEVLREHQQDLLQRDRHGFLALQAQLRQRNSDMLAIFKMAQNPMASPAVQALAAKMTAPGGSFEQMFSQATRMGINLPESEEVQTMKGLASGLGSDAMDQSYLPEATLQANEYAPTISTGGDGDQVTYGDASYLGGSLDPRMAGIIDAASRRFNVPGDFIKQVITAESGGNPTAVSSAGAQGIMQIMPTTAAQYGGMSNPLNPAQNIMMGSQILGSLLKRYHGNHALALIGYNAGPGVADRVAQGDLSSLPKETHGYLLKILGQDPYASAPVKPSPTPSATAPAPEPSATPPQDQPTWWNPMTWGGHQQAAPGATPHGTAPTPAAAPTAGPPQIPEMVDVGQVSALTEKAKGIPKPHRLSLLEASNAFRVLDPHTQAAVVQAVNALP